MADQLDLTAISGDDLRRLPWRIGNTPVVEVHLAGVAGRVHVKLEGANPGGSSKDRPALHILDSLRRQGRLPAGAHVVDSTSGNWGVSVAWLARARGYRFTAVSDPRVSPENLARIRRLGAVVEIVEERDETGGYLLTRVRRAQAIAESEGAVWLNQYGNAGNPEAHYRATAPELWAQMDGQLDVVFIPASTGGTLAGISRYLREHSPRTTVVAVDGEGSVMFGASRPGPRLVNGLGSSRPSDFLDAGTYDQVVRVPAREAFRYCRALASEGLWVGGSSGAAVAACAALLRADGGSEVRALCLCPDQGANYRSTIFDDGWLASNGLRMDHRGLVRGAAEPRTPSPRRPVGGRPDERRPALDGRAPPRSPLGPRPPRSGVATAARASPSRRRCGPRPGRGSGGSCSAARPPGCPCRAAASPGARRSHSARCPR
jgi:N-(2-amino-2-carboxyethyl)-L-glutamate synthase